MLSNSDAHAIKVVYTCHMSLNVSECVRTTAAKPSKQFIPAASALLALMYDSSRRPCRRHRKKRRTMATCHWPMPLAEARCRTRADWLSWLALGTSDFCPICSHNMIQSLIGWATGAHNAIGVDAGATCRWYNSRSSLKDPKVH